jgi:hypothetical protein
MKRSFYGWTMCLLALTGTVNANTVTSDPFLWGEGRSFRHVGPATRYQVGNSVIEMRLDIDMGGPQIPLPAIGTTTVNQVPTKAINGVPLLINGLAPSGPVNMLPGMMTIQTTRISDFAFETKILALDYQLSLPGSTISVRQSPTTQSTGTGTVTPPSVHWDSFFSGEVRFELNGQVPPTPEGWYPATDGPSQIESVPTPGLGPILGMSALLALRRRR